jgi:cytochrome c peroxidase
MAPLKSKILLLFSVAMMLLLLANCRRDPQITRTSNQGGPDSLYQGTKYKIAVPFQFPPLPTSTNPYLDSLTVEGILLGRRLFYDKHLSLNGQMACASCHFLQHGFADSVAIATNEFGPNKRNAPALINLAWAPALFWDGRQPTLAAQAQDAFHNELGLNVSGAITYLQNDSVYPRLFKKAFGRPGTITEKEIYLGIQEFLSTVISANSRFDSCIRGQAVFTAGEADAFYNLFITNRGECYHCHAQGQTYLMVNYAPGFVYTNTGYQAANTIDQFADPGRGAITGDSAQYGLFKNPTLRNIAVSGPYMHDGGYKTLQQVINFYSDSLRLSPTVDPNVLFHMDTADGHYLQTGGLHFDSVQKAEMLQLLNDFTDPTFLNDPAFSNPFPH